MDAYGNGVPMVDEKTQQEALGFLSPQDFERVKAAAYAPNQQRMLEQQLAEIQALRNKPMATHRTGLAAAIGGIGDAVEGIGQAREAKNIRGQLGGLLDTQKAAGGTILDAIAAVLRGKRAPMATEPDYGFNYSSPMNYGR